MLHVVPVVDLLAPALAPYRALRDRDVSREHGVFVAEGWEVVGRLLRSRWKVRSALVIHTKLERFAALCERHRWDGQVYVAPEDVVGQLVGFPMHRGVMALGERLPAWEGLFGAASGPASILALCGVNNHENVGHAFRNAAAFGVGAVVMDSQTADPLYRKALRVSMGHALGVPFTRVAEQGQMLALLKASGYRLYGASPSPEGVDAERWAAGERGMPERVAVVLGPEGPGLAPKILSMVDEWVRIRMAEGVDSLNVATAGAVLLFALRAASPTAFSGSPQGRVD